MSRRSFFVTLGCFLLGLGVVATVLAGLLRYQCPWYKQALQPPGPERTQNSDQFLCALSDLWNNMDALSWNVRFTDQEINGYLQEGFRSDGDESLKWTSEGISDLRVAFDTDRIHLAFRYGSGLFSTVIRVDLHVWLVPKDPSVVVLELEGFYAGALPISARSLLEQISEVGRRNDVGVNWYRDQKSGHPVAVLHFQKDEQHAKWGLQALQLEPGVMAISGCSTEAPSTRPESAAPAPGSGN